jgi:predicted Rossmann fold nucleotide-binding protein DprA/Smf involved in DNA uptake
MKAIQTDPEKVKIAIIGSREYENKRKIRDMIFKLKQTFGSKLEIISGGCTSGADKYAKKFSLELGVSYREFNPAHTVKNLYSVLPETYYSKPYHTSQFFHRNELIAKYCDRMIAFIDSNVASKGSHHAVDMAQKHSKPVVIINEKS